MTFMTRWTPDPTRCTAADERLAGGGASSDSYRFS